MLSDSNFSPKVTSSSPISKNNPVVKSTTSTVEEQSFENPNEEEMSTEVCTATTDLQKFSNSRRVGRRNAMGDLNVEGMDPIEAQKLAEQFAQMGHDDLEEEGGPSTSNGEKEGTSEIDNNGLTTFSDK